MPDRRRPLLHPLIPQAFSPRRGDGTSPKPLDGPLNKKARQIGRAFFAPDPSAPRFDVRDRDALDRYCGKSVAVAPRDAATARITPES